MKTKTKLLSCLLSVLCFTHVQGQVTIGSGIEPLGGAILDLKQWPQDDGEANSKIGLMLPRVELSALDKLYPMFTGTYDAAENKKHTGLTVYNSKATPEVPAVGPYTWDGEKWVAVTGTSSGGTAYYAANGLTLNGTYFSLGGTLTNNTTINAADQTLTLSGSDAGLVSVSAPFAITSGSPGTDKVLTSDATGNATWQPLPSSTVTNPGTGGGTVTLEPGSGCTCFAVYQTTASSRSYSVSGGTRAGWYIISSGADAGGIFLRTINTGVAFTGGATGVWNPNGDQTFTYPGGLFGTCVVPADQPVQLTFPANNGISVFNP